MFDLGVGPSCSIRPYLLFLHQSGAVNARIGVGNFQQFVSQLGYFSFPAKDSWVGVSVGIALMAVGISFFHQNARTCCFKELVLSSSFLSLGDLRFILVLSALGGAISLG